MSKFFDPMGYSPQSPLSMWFFRQEYWNGLPFLSPRDLSNSEIKPTSPELAGEFFTTEPQRKPPNPVAGFISCLTFSLLISSTPHWQSLFEKLKALWFRLCSIAIEMLQVSLWTPIIWWHWLPTSLTQPPPVLRYSGHWSSPFLLLWSQGKNKCSFFSASVF